MRTAPKDENLGTYDDVTVGHLDAFDWRSPEFIDLTVTIDDKRLAIKVGKVAHEVLVKDMPYGYGAGKVRVTTSRCRVRIQEVELTPLPSNQSRRGKRKDP